MTGERNLLRYPLNELLGSEAHVRLLRVLAHEVAAPLNAPDAAERVGLTPAGARKALNRLTQTGFLGRVGGGRSQQFALREPNPLLDVLKEMFRVEQARYESLLSRLRSAFQDVPEVQSAWIERVPTRIGEPLELGVLATSSALPWLKDELRARLKGMESDFDIIIELAAYSRADAPEIDPETVTLLAGIIAPDGSFPSSAPAKHSQREERALRLSRGIATLLRSDPSIVKRATRHIDRLLAEDQGAAAQDLLEWRQVLETYSNERLQDFLKSESSRAARLRQSSPFFAILSADEQDRLLSYLEQHP